MIYASLSFGVSFGEGAVKPEKIESKEINKYQELSRSTGFWSCVQVHSIVWYLFFFPFIKYKLHSFYVNERAGHWIWNGRLLYMDSSFGKSEEEEIVQVIY